MHPRFEPHFIPVLPFIDLNEIVKFHLILIDISFQLTWTHQGEVTSHIGEHYRRIYQQSPS
jgi:hypothetical protein